MELQQQCYVAQWWCYSINCATFWAVNLASLHHLTEQNKPAQHGCSRQLYVSTVGFTKFRVIVGTSLCTTAQHISSKIKAFLHHLCWVILILNYAIPYFTPLSLTYPEVRFPRSTQKSQYFFSSQNVLDCQKWLSKFVQSIDIMTLLMIFLWDAKNFGEILALLRLLSKFSKLVIIQL